MKEPILVKLYRAIDKFGEPCEWCGIYVLSRQKHHYPIPKKDGGKNVVKICPNCHSNYHYYKNNLFIRLMSRKNINKKYKSANEYIENFRRSK